MIRSCTPARYVTRHSVVFPGRRCVGEDPKSRLKLHSLGEVAVSSRLLKRMAPGGRMTRSCAPARYVTRGSVVFPGRGRDE